MATAEPLRMSITLDRAFNGWTELFAALQAAIADGNTKEEVGGQDL